ncbi:MAG TPA: hypothetical protein VJR94_04630 [Candidatus Nitrosocosmicus sp.]|nr:hypothetical protein [Candidatus Nitrosocosmicus sp.]
MNQRHDSTLGLQMRKLARVITAFFIISVILFSSGNTVYSTTQGIISGAGYGNNGERYGSFLSCSNSDVVHHFKGSSIQFKTALGDNSVAGKNSDLSLGSWSIDFIAEDSQSPVRLGGPIIEANLENNMYTLLGEETFDDICGIVGNTITLTGECGENTKIWYSDSNNAKVGSFTPPHGEKINYLFGSEVNCF